MKANLVACVLVWSVILAIGCYLVGWHFRANAGAGAEVKAQEKSRKQLARKNAKGLAAGMRTEQAQADADTTFQRLRADYESDQKNNPGIGCVLDPVSLRRWNEANGQSNGTAPGESDGEVPTAAAGESGRERGQQPHRDSAALPPVPKQDGGLD